MQPAFFAFGSLFVLIGVGITAFILSRIRKAMQSRHWPRTAGKLEHADLEAVNVDLLTRSRFSGAHDSFQTLKFDFAYTYQVNSKTYRGKRVTFADSTVRTRKMMERILDNYRHQRHVIVHYNPRNPADSVLIPGASFANFGPLITSMLFIAFGIYIITL